MLTWLRVLLKLSTATPATADFGQPLLISYKLVITIELLPSPSSIIMPHQTSLTGYLCLFIAHDNLR